MAKYSKIFDGFDQSKKGLISDEQMQSVFKKTALDRKLVSKCGYS